MISTPLTKILGESLILDKRDLFLAIKENNKRRNACNKHDFSTKLEDCFSHSYKYQCKECGALCDSNYKLTYELGLKHGREENR